MEGRNPGCAAEGPRERGKKENSVKWCFTSSTECPTWRVSPPANEEDSGKSGELSQGSCRKSGKGGQKCTCARTHTLTHVHTCTPSHTSTLSHTHTSTFTYLHTSHIHTCSRTHIHTHARIPTGMHTLTHSHPHSHTQGRTDPQKESREKTDSSRNPPKKSPLI